MMPSHCSVPLCRSKVRGHQFPSDPVLKKKWLVAIRMDVKFEPTEKAIVCYEHFSQEQYATVNVNGHKPMRKWLKKDAVPWKFEWTSLATVYQDADYTRHFECPDKGWENEPSNTANVAINEAVVPSSHHHHHARFDTYRKEKSKDDDDDVDDRFDHGHHELATKQDPSQDPIAIPSRSCCPKPLMMAPIRTTLNLEGYANSRPRTSVLFQLRHVYCTTCQCRFASAAALAQHLVVHSIFVCLVCGKEMDNDLSFRDHQNVQC